MDEVFGIQFFFFPFKGAGHAHYTKLPYAF